MYLLANTLRKKNPHIYQMTLIYIPIIIKLYWQYGIP